MIQKNTLFKISKFISTFFYVGFAKKAPGTMGSLATIPFWLLINYLLLNLLKIKETNYITVILTLTISLYFIGYYSTKIYMAETKKEDPSETVIDEVVGQIIAFIITLSALVIFSNYKINPNNPWIIVPILITPFILFRFFDITKPNLIGYIDKNWNNAHGVMLDDVIAGIYAGICNIGIFYLFIKYVL